MRDEMCVFSRLRYVRIYISRHSMGTHTQTHTHKVDLSQADGWANQERERERERDTRHK